MKLYEMTISMEKIETFRKCLQTDYTEKISIEKEVPIPPNYITYHLNTSDITRKELAEIQDRFLF